MSSIYKLGRRTVLVGLIVAFIFIAVLSSAHSQDPHVSKIESDDPAVVRAGTWSSQTASQASGGGYLYNAPSPINGDDVALSLQFSGPSIEILYVSGPNLGTMAIEIDDVVLRTVITTAPQTAYQQSATIDYLTDEAHTLRVYAQAGGVIGVDAFSVTSLALPSYSVQVPIQRSPRLASPDCGTPAAVRRMAIPIDGSVGSAIDISTRYAPQVQLSGDGQYIVFPSTQRNLLPNLIYPPTSNFPEPAAYRVNTQTCQIELVSQYANGNLANANVGSISSDARYITLNTQSSLVTADTNETSDLYLRDMATGIISLISRNSEGEVGNGETYLSTMSRNGRYIAFVSTASNLDPADTSDDDTMFIFDRQLDQLSVVPDIVTPHLQMRPFGGLAISDDGRYVVYQFSVYYVYQETLPPYPILHFWVNELFLTDQQTQTSVQITNWGGNNPYSPGNSHPEITADGRYIFFESRSSSAGINSVSMYDRATTTLSWVADAQIESSQLENYAISSDGRYVAFTHLGILYQLDRQTDITRRFSEGFDGQIFDNQAFLPGVSDDGRYVTFVSRASNIVPNDDDPDYWGSGTADLFLIDQQLIRPTHTTLDARPAHARRIDLSWVQHAPTATQFEVQRLSPGFGNNWVVVGTTALGATTYSDTSVVLGARYYYRLRVLTSDPTFSEYSTVVRVTTYEFLYHTYLMANPIGSGQVELTWIQYAPTPTEFEVQRSRGDYNWTVLGTIPIGQTNYIDSGIVCGFTYSYRLRPLILHPDYSDMSYVAYQATICPPDALAVIDSNTRQISLIHTLADPVPSGAITTFTSNARASGQWVMGDWDGDGNETPGVYEASGAFMYTNELGPTATWRGVWFGLFGKPPIVGRFERLVYHDCLGVIDSAYFAAYDRVGFAVYYACDLTGSTTPPMGVQWLGFLLQGDPSFQGDFQFAAGDFDKDTIDTIAVRRGIYVAWTNDYLTSHSAGFSEAQYWGATLTSADYGYLVTGDWNNNGTDSFGFMFQNGDFTWRDDLLWNNGGLTTTQHTGLSIGLSIQAASWH